MPRNLGSRPKGHFDNPNKFWRILNDSLLKRNKDNCHTTFDKGNGEFTGISYSCEYMNNHFANIGACLHNQCNTTVSLDVFDDMYDFQTAEDELEFTLEDILTVVKNINVYKGSGVKYVPPFI